MAFDEIHIKYLLSIGYELILGVVRNLQAGHIGEF